jgi:peptidoglycan hydrolase-like protein with peptidoglycan-binding domain
MVALAAGAGLLAAAAPAAGTPALTTWLHKGSRGSNVTRVQRALHVRKTGQFSAPTQRAVRAFQRKDGLMVDGVVGYQTWDALFHIAPAPGAAPGTAAAPSSAATSTGYTVPSGIVQCESGGNYSAVNPSSGAGGAYQILPSTWAAYGGQGLPQDASPAEQGRIASEIYAHQGPSAWKC